MATNTALTKVMRELAALEHPKMRAANEQRGDDHSDGLDLEALLDQIEKELKHAPAQKQWAMNHCLAEIGIHHPKHRARAIRIGERLEVLKDYPASPGCTPPYAPLWIAEMVRRREGHKGSHRG